MRVTTRSLAPAILLAITASSAVGQQQDRSRCAFACVTVHQVVSIDTAEHIELTCHERLRGCSGQGFFRIDDERLPVTIGALVWPDKISIGMKSENYVFITLDGTAIHFEVTSATVKQSKDFFLQGMPQRWLTPKDQELLAPIQPVIRKGIRLPGFVRIEFEKTAIE